MDPTAMVPRWTIEYVMVLFPSAEPAMHPTKQGICGTGHALRRERQALANPEQMVAGTIGPSIFYYRGQLELRRDESMGVRNRRLRRTERSPNGNAQQKGSYCPTDGKQIQ